MNKNIITAFILLFSAMLIGMELMYYLIDRQLDQQVAYVEVPKLYEDFDMTEQLNRKYSDIVSNRQLLVDSLNLSLAQLQPKTKVMTQPQEQERLSLQIQEIINQKEQILQSNAQMKADFESQIWNQLNTYIRDFGDQENYKMLLGATGDGNVLYAKQYINATQELIAYVSDRYNHK